MPLLLAVGAGGSASTAAGRSRATRSSAACRRCGRSAASTPWTRRIPTTRRSCTGSSPATADGHRDHRHVGHARDARDAEPGHGPRSRRSCPTTRCALVCPAGFAGAGPFHVGVFAWALMGFSAIYLGAGPPGLRHHRREDAAADVDRADELDGAPSRGAAQRRRDADRARRGRGDARPHRAPTGPRRRARGLAGAARGDALVRHRPGVRHRRPRARPERRRRARSSATGSSRSSATSGWAASTRATRCSPTS